MTLRRGLALLAVLLVLAIAYRAEPSQGQAATWTAIDPAGVSNNPNNPANNYGYNSIVVDPFAPATLYLGTNYQGLYKSTNSGASWVKANTGIGGALLDGGRLWTLAADPFHQGTLYTTAGYGNGGVLKSTDGGASWQDKLISTGSTLQTEDVYSIAVDPFTAGHLLASFHYYWYGTQDSGVVESSDGGSTWTIHAAQAGWGAGNAVWFGNNASTWLLGSQNNGLWRTADSGAHWTQMNANAITHGGTGALVRDPASGTLYIALTTQILKSTNNGASWTVIGDSNSGLPYAYYETVAFDGTNLYTAPSYPILGTYQSGPWYIAPAAGGAWHAQGTQTTCDPAGSCNGPVFTARSGSTAYAANWNGGVWRLGGGIAPTQTPTNSPTPSPSPTPTPVPPNGLHVSGNKLLAADGSTVVLKGVNRSGSEYECLSGGAIFDGPTDAASIAAMQSWHINTVRLPLNEDCWLGINGVPAATAGSAYQQAIAAYVTALTSAGIYVQLDLQWAAPGTTLSNGLVPMADADHAAFWTGVANAFKSNGSVLFDLFNEPYPDNNSNSAAAWACLRDGGTCPGVGYSAAGMQTLVNVVRATGAANVVVVSGVQYSDVLDQWLNYRPVDLLNNLIASWHNYATQICYNNRTYWNQIAAVAQSVPLVAGEIGENDCAHGYIDSLMTFLDGIGAGYLGWAWDAYDCSSFPALITGYDGTPTDYGIGLRNHLLGANCAQTKTLTYTPQAGPTVTVTAVCGETLQ